MKTCTKCNGGKCLLCGFTGIYPESLEVGDKTATPYTPPKWTIENARYSTMMSTCDIPAMKEREAAGQRLQEDRPTVKVEARF